MWAVGMEAASVPAAALRRTHAIVDPSSINHHGLMVKRLTARGTERVVTEKLFAFARRIFRRSECGMKARKPRGRDRLQAAALKTNGLKLK
jgi:hypothetical protein